MNMKKLISILSIGLLLFTACQQEVLDTNQYSSSEVKLVSFGPNPVMRGATLCFYGSNLDKVGAVEVPGVAPITDIEVVKSGNPSEIRVQLPAEGTEVGKVKLVAGKKELFTQSEVTYIEPIVFESFSATEAMPGDVITITGDYMNLVTEVIFANEVSVPVNAGATRHQTSVTVPANAITGEPILTDGENLIYSFTEIKIGKPTVTSLTIEDARPGKPAVVEGTFLNMIEKFVFEGGVVLDTTAFTLNEGNTSISVDIPSKAKSGDVLLISYAKDTLNAGSVTMIRPAGLSVSPVPVKAGSALEISGSDLELVTSVDFVGASGATFSCAEGKITVESVPATAVEGDITLVMDNGESSTVAFTLVHPTVVSIAPATITAGDTLVVSGTDLDLISGVTLGGKEEAFEASEDELKIATAATSVSGKIVLKLANGETVEPADEITVNYDSFIVVNEMPAAEHIGAAVTFKGTNFMMIDRIYIGEAKVSQYIKRSDDEISFIMPYNKVGTYSITFELLNGDKEVCPTKIEVLLQQSISVVWEGNVDLGAWSVNWEVPADAFTKIDMHVGQQIRYYVTPTADWWQFQLFDGHWAALVVDESTDGSNNINTNKMDISSGYISIKVTEDILTKFTTFVDWGYSGIIQGESLILTKIEVVEDIPQEVTIFKGPVSLTWGDDGRFGLAMSYFEKATPGSKLIFYFEQTENWGQVQLNDGWWANADMTFPEIGGAYITTDNVGGKDVTRLELTLTEAVLNHILASPGDYFGLNTDYQGDGRVAMVIQGSDWIIKEVTIL